MLPTYPLHTPWLLYSRSFAHVLFGRQNKELVVGDYIYYTQIFDFVNAVAKKGGFWCCSCVLFAYNICGLFIRIPQTFSRYFLQNSLQSTMMTYATYPTPSMIRILHTISGRLTRLICCCYCCCCSSSSSWWGSFAIWIWVFCSSSSLETVHLQLVRFRQARLG